MCRGASALVDGFRWVLGLQRSESDGENKSIFVKLMKTNYCKIGPTLEFDQDFSNGGILKLKGIVKEIVQNNKNTKNEDENECLIANHGVKNEW